MLKLLLQEDFLKLKKNVWVEGTPLLGVMLWNMAKKMKLLLQNIEIELLFQKKIIVGLGFEPKHIWAPCCEQTGHRLKRWVPCCKLAMLSRFNLRVAHLRLYSGPYWL